MTEQVIRGKTAENDGHTHSYRVDAYGSGFTIFDSTKHIHAIGAWKVKTAHAHEHELIGGINEAAQSFVLQEYLFGWYDAKFFKTLKEAQTFAQKRYDNIVKRNKKAEKDLRPKSYGSEQLRATRVVDKSVRPYKYYPGTKEDKQNWNKQKKNYLQEAKKVVWVKKPDFMKAMGIDPDYLVRETRPDTFEIAKFTHGKEPADLYRCTWTGKKWSCNCYSRKGSCKHVDIVQKYIKGKKKSEFEKWMNKK